MRKIYTRILAVCLLLLFTVSFLGCGNYQSNPDLSKNDQVVLRFAGPWEDFKALGNVSLDFGQIYPNCIVEYEYLQNYNDSLSARLQGNEDCIDLFITGNIQKDSPYLNNALDIYESKYVKLDDTFEGLIHNFECLDENKETHLYAVPFGAEIRGMFVNKTLLKSVGLEVPKTLIEFKDACKILYSNGYIPLQANPSVAGQQLIYPYICNIVANSADHEQVYNNLEARMVGCSEYFREPMALLYELMSNGYYNYKYVESVNGKFMDGTDEAVARDFLNIVNQNDEYVKKDDTGDVPFMISSISQVSIVERIKEDYHSDIDFEFILSPISDNGGYAYLSPTHGIAINKNSENREWAEEFLNFFFTKTENVKFAEENHVIPNTKDAMNIISKQFDVPTSNVSHLGQVTFSYGFYKAVANSLLDVVKGNNPKYMQEDGSLYDLEHYMQLLEKRLTTPEE